MLQTMDIDFIINELHENLFDFNYNFVEKSYTGIRYTKQKLQDDFINRFKYYQIGYSTLEEFKWRLQNVWLENIDTLNMTIAGFTTIDFESLPMFHIGRRGRSSGETSNDNRYSNTPNQKIINFNDKEGYLTDITINKNNGSSEYEEEEVTNPMINYSKYKKYLKNPLYEFFDKFNVLFITDIITNDLLIPVR